MTHAIGVGFLYHIHISLQMLVKKKLLPSVSEVLILYFQTDILLFCCLTFYFLLADRKSNLLFIFTKRCGYL